LPLTNVQPAKDTYALFGNEAVFFILGAFLLAAALIRCGLSTRVALAVLRRFGHTPRTLLLSFFLMNAFMAFFMSEHAVGAMTFPITLEIASVLGLQRQRSSYGRALFIAMAWGTQIGGIATLLGGGRAPLALGMLHEATGQGFSFAEWTLAALPVVAALLVVGWVILSWFFPIAIEDVRRADAVIAEKAMRMGRPSARERAIGFIMLGTLAAWIVGGEEFGLATIALSAVVLIFAAGLLTWSDIEQYVNWGVLLMYGGAIALGAAINHSGAAGWGARQAGGHRAPTPAGGVAAPSGGCVVVSGSPRHSRVG